MTKIIGRKRPLAWNDDFFREGNEEASANWLRLKYNIQVSWAEGTVNNGTKCHSNSVFRQFQFIISFMNP